MKKSEFIRPSNGFISDEELIKDLQDIAKTLEKNTITHRSYDVKGKYSSTRIIQRFKTWNKALEIANLSFSNESNISDERLYENILNICRVLVLFNL